MAVREAAVHHRLERLRQRRGVPEHVEDLALEPVDALGRVEPVRREHVGLHLLDREVERVGDGLVVVDHPVAHRVQDGGGPAAQLLDVGLELATHLARARSPCHGGP